MLGIDLLQAFDWNLSLETRHRYLDSVLFPKGYAYLGTGRHRMTWLAPHERFVLKFPRNIEGVEDNQAEARLWKKRQRYTAQFAPCRLLTNSILLMKTVVELHGRTVGCHEGARVLNKMANIPSLPRPAWTSYVEMQQVGRLPNGKWVAYDYADYYYE